jgi:hypothetical protein
VLVHPGRNFKLKVSLTGLQSSHLHAGKSMKHAHASNAHIILEMSLTHKIKFMPKPCTNQCIISLCYGQRENPQKKVRPHCMQQTFWWYPNAKNDVISSPLGFVHPYQVCAY